MKSIQSNFKFLENDFPTIAKIGGFAEKILNIDPNTSLIKVRQLTELIIKMIIKYENLQIYENSSQYDNLRLLKKFDLINDEIFEIFDRIRKKGNMAAHDLYDSKKEAKLNIKLAWKLAGWFQEVYGNDINFNTNELQFNDKKYLIFHEKSYIKELDKVKNELEYSIKNFDEYKKAIIKRADKKKASLAAQKIILNEDEAFEVVFKGDKKKINLMKQIHQEFKNYVPVEAKSKTRYRYLDDKNPPNIGVNIYNIKVFEIKDFPRKKEKVLLIYPRYKEGNLSNIIESNELERRKFYKFVFDCDLVWLTVEEVLNFEEKNWCDVSQAIKAAVNQRGKEHRANMLVNW